jgi:FlaA1/EpsC-like NDP-sugar epimerase
VTPWLLWWSLFFLLILDDVIGHYSTYYRSFGVLFLLEFMLTYIPRLIITSVVSGKIHRREAGFRTLIVGSREKAARLISEIRSEKMPAGNLLTGFLTVSGDSKRQPDVDIRRLGGADEIIRVIEEHEIDEVILAMEEDEYGQVERLSTLSVTVMWLSGLYHPCGELFQVMLRRVLSMPHLC